MKRRIAVSCIAIVAAVTVLVIAYRYWFVSGSSSQYVHNNEFRVWHDFATDEHLSREHFSPYLTLVDLGNTGAGSLTLPKIANLSKLERLTLGKSFRDEYAHWITQAKSIRVLHINSDALTDKGASELLNSLSSLELLILECPKVTDMSFAKLASLGCLKSVFFTGKVGKNGLSSLAEACNLESLVITHGAEISTESISVLRSATQLVSIELYDADIGDAGCRELAECHKLLRNVAIGGTSLTEAGIGALSELPELRRVYIGNATFTQPMLNAITHWVALKQLEVDSASKQVELSKRLEKKRPDLLVTAHGIPMW